jgi:uncharacterized membrane protein YciS (DUF1049 family)
MRYLAVALAAVLYAIGWLAGWVHLALLWLWSALAVGWDDAHRIGARRAQRERRVSTATPERAIPDWPAERPREAA